MESMENVHQRMQVDFLLHSGVQLAGEALHFSEGIFLRGSGWLLAEHDDAVLGMTGHLFAQNASSMKTDSIVQNYSVLGTNTRNIQCSWLRKERESTRRACIFFIPPPKELGGSLSLDIHYGLQWQPRS